MEKYYLAYGSNLNKAQMAIRCPGAVAVGTATLQGFRLMFKGSKTGSYLTIEEDADESVPVGVWKVNEDHERALDRYEGFPSFYYKQAVKVKVRRKTLDAFVYIMHEDRPHGLPTSYYMLTCCRGYSDFELDPEPLYKAVEYTKQQITKNKPRRTKKQ